ncbi:MAG: ABC transporter ATP-binding protein [Oligoflexia bacterium]|nr:ABC transporter ATP-binding protein [Oligoflexia bacterium]
MIRTRALSRSFGEKKVLAGTTLEIVRGERVALLGPNGSGKTTLLRVLAGLLMPSSGDAWIDGISVAREPLRAKARLGYVPASESGFFPRFTGRENLLFFAGLRGLPPRESLRQLERLRALKPLESALETPFQFASSGMKQALCLARALLGDPPVLLLDEPTRSLDPEAALELHAFLATGLADKTALFVTHSTEEASRCATRVVRLSDLQLDRSQASAPPPAFESPQGVLA